MNTPICDFVNEYARSNALRLHMPGHKGAGMLGVEALDITEIDGADSLYSAQGIIGESEESHAACKKDNNAYHGKERFQSFAHSLLLLLYFSPYSLKNRNNLSEIVPTVKCLFGLQ